MAVWKQGTAYTIDEACSYIMSHYGDALSNGAHLVITGGEPLIHDSVIVKLLEELSYPSLYVEIETNGTIQPSLSLSHHVSQWNVSPKLSNSGETFEDRIITNCLDWFSQQQHSYFKFVVSNESDINEIQDTFSQIMALPIQRRYLMPASDTKASLHSLLPQCVEWAKQYGFCISHRYQLSIWDQKTGV